MTSWKRISLSLSILTTLFLCDIGISIAESSLLGILGCLLGAIMMPGFGFMLKEKFNIQ